MYTLYNLQTKIDILQPWILFFQHFDDCSRFIIWARPIWAQKTFFSFQTLTETIHSFTSWSWCSQGQLDIFLLWLMMCECIIGCYYFFFNLITSCNMRNVFLLRKLVYIYFQGFAEIWYELLYFPKEENSIYVYVLWFVHKNMFLILWHVSYFIYIFFYRKYVDRI